METKNENFTKELYDDIFVHRKNVFITGSGGTGKSYLINNIKEAAEEKKLFLAKTSTTGLSSVNINGCTIHHWSGIKIGKDPPELVVAMMDPECKARWTTTDILTIDEVSMLTDKVFNLINEVGKRVRQSDKPFGGIQLILTGDFLQLPPIGGCYVFQTLLWDKLEIKVHKLIKPFRFTDKSYYELLQRVRLGKPSEKDIERLKTRIEAYNEYKENENDEEIKPTKLYALKKNINEINMMELNKLPGEIQQYTCIDKVINLNKSIKSKKITSRDIEYYQKILDRDIDARKFLKVGAQVMLTYNLSVDLGLVNGSRGIVKMCELDGVTVRFKNGLTTKIEYLEYLFEDNRVRYTRQQIPLILAWSLNYHKIQGATLDSAIMDLGITTFGPNIVYVALSRVRNIEGLYLTSFMPEKIKAHEYALEFEESIK